MYTYNRKPHSIFIIFLIMVVHKKKKKNYVYHQTKWNDICNELNKNTSLQWLGLYGTHTHLMIKKYKKTMQIFEYEKISITVLTQN